jgi:hypothetical protein
MNTKKIRFQGLRRVYNVPSWSRFVAKGTAPKGATTLILPTLTTNPNRVVVELFGHQGGLALVIVGRALASPINNR